MRELFAVAVREDRIGGVRVHRVEPGPGPAGKQRPRADLPARRRLRLGRQFRRAGGSHPDRRPDGRGGDRRRLQAGARAPVSRGVGGCRRGLRGPDRTAMRRAPSGLYGCSAGGVLTAQAVAWFARTGLPRPGAVAILGAGGGEMRRRFRPSGAGAGGIWSALSASHCGFAQSRLFRGRLARGPLRLSRRSSGRPAPLPAHPADRRRPGFRGQQRDRPASEAGRGGRRDAALHLRRPLARLPNLSRTCRSRSRSIGSWRASSTAISPPELAAFPANPSRTRRPP